MKLQRKRFLGLTVGSHWNWGVSARTKGSKRDQKGSKRSELSCHPILLARSERVQSTQASSPEIAPDHNRYLYPWAILMSLGTLNGVYWSAGESAILPSLFRWHNSLRVNLSDRCKAFLQHPPSCPMGVASVRVCTGEGCRNGRINQPNTILEGLCHPLSISAITKSTPSPKRRPPKGKNESQWWSSRINSSSRAARRSRRAKQLWRIVFLKGLA